MKKYLSIAISITYTLIKFCFIKLFHMKNFKFTKLSIISPFTEIEIGKKASLFIGKMVRVRSYLAPY